MAAFVVKLDPNFKQENNTDAENSQAITRWGAGKRWGYAYVEAGIRTYRWEKNGDGAVKQVALAVPSYLVRLKIAENSTKYHAAFMKAIPGPHIDTNDALILDEAVEATATFPAGWAGSMSDLVNIKYLTEGIARSLSLGVVRVARYMYNGRWIIGANGPTFTETRHLRIECKPSAAETYIRPWMVYLDQGISAIPTNIRFTGLDVTQLQPTISYEFPNDDKEHESEAILSTAAKDLKYPNVGVAAGPLTWTYGTITATPDTSLSAPIDPGNGTGSYRTIPVAIPQQPNQRPYYLITFSDPTRPTASLTSRWYLTNQSQLTFSNISTEFIPTPPPVLMEVIDFTNAPGWPTPDARQLLKNVAISRGMGFAFVRSGVHEDSWDQFNKKVKDLPHVTMMFKKDRDDSVEWPAHVYVDAEDKLVLRGVRWYKSVQR